MRKYCKALANVAVALVILLLILFVVPRVLIFFMPFVIGWIIALIASPMVRFCEEKMKIKRKAGSAVVIIAVIAVIVLLLYLVGLRLVEESISFIEEIPQMWESLEKDSAAWMKNLDGLCKKLPGNVQTGIDEIGAKIGTYIGSFIGKLGTPTINAVTSFAVQLPTVLIGIIMCLLSAYFFVAERASLSEWIKKHMPAGIEMRYQIMRRSLVVAVGGYLKAQLKIEVWMYLLLVIGLGILQVEHVLLIALGIAFMDFLPFFGTGTVMVPWAVIEIIAANYKTAVGLLIIWCVGQLARQLIQPKIVGDSIGVKPIPTLFLLYIGYKLAGVAGMIVSVPIGLIIGTMYEEGAFDTTVNSMRILAAGINSFRRLEKSDLEIIEEEKRAEENAKH